MQQPPEVSTGGGFHLTITRDALGLTIQGCPNPSPGPSHFLPMQGPPILPSRIVTSGGQDWRPVQSCSLEDPSCAEI